MNDAGDKFQQTTKYDPQNMRRHAFASGGPPPLYKQYRGRPNIALAPYEPGQAMPLHQTLKRRRSIRDFRQEPITRDQLSYLLWASTGIQRVEAGYEFRTAPSAGALYPIETYLVINNVRQVEMGLYHYAVKPHQLEQLKQGDFRRQTAAAALGQPMCATASVVFVWSAIFQRCKYKYGQRAYRYIYLDAGHIAGNLALAAVSVNLGSCQVGAFYDDPVNELLDIDGTNESTIYMSVVGVPA
ncbi:MAG: SagB/ThcOx family dehydrogenase [Planctomycetota bacterium]|jgi:SagB-type dehydrogenase family enzyme